MKKAKFLALALAGAITLMGAGYAAWSDSLTITSTVSTGYVDLYFISQNNNEITPSSNVITGSVTYTADTESELDANGNKHETTLQDNYDIATVTVGNMYPGSRATVNLKIKNNSTIPVKLTTDINSIQVTPPRGITINPVSVTYTPDNAQSPTTLLSSNVAGFKDKLIEEKTDITIIYEFVAGQDVIEETNYSFTVPLKFDQGV